MNFKMIAPEIRAKIIRSIQKIKMFIDTDITLYCATGLMCIGGFVHNNIITAISNTVACETYAIAFSNSSIINISSIIGVFEH